MLFLLPETLDAAHRRPFRLRDAHVTGAFRPLFEAGRAGPLLLAWFLGQVGGMVYPATWAFWEAIRCGGDATVAGPCIARGVLLTALVQDETSDGGGERGQGRLRQ